MNTIQGKMGEIDTRMNMMESSGMIGSVKAATADDQDPENMFPGDKSSDNSSDE
jgi:hypothetical protein